MYIADNSNHKIKMIPVIANTYFGQVMEVNKIYTIAGSPASPTQGTEGDVIGALSTSKLTRPHGISVDTLGNVYIADTINAKIKKILVNQYYNIVFTQLNSGYKVDNIDALYYNQGIVSLIP